MCSETSKGCESVFLVVSTRIVPSVLCKMCMQGKSCRNTFILMNLRESLVQAEVRCRENIRLLHHMGQVSCEASAFVNDARLKVSQDRAP